MKRLFTIALCACIFSAFVGCSNAADEGERAAATAKMLYDSLFAGRADIFIGGHYDADSLPTKYREERIDNAKMFVEQQNSEHRGVQSVRISRAEVVDSLNKAAVFLILCYGDSTNEEIVVPMTKQANEWMLR